MPKKKKPSHHGGDPFEGKGGINNNNDHPSQRRRVNTAGEDRKTRAGVVVNSDGKNSVIGIAGNRNHRSSGHSSGQSSGRANFEKLFSSSSDEEDAGNEVEDGGEEEWEVPTTTVAAAASRPQRGKVVNYSYKTYHKKSQRQFKDPSFNRFSALADDDDDEEDASVDERKMPASVKNDNFSEDETDTDSNPSGDDSDEFEIGDVSEESSLEADSTESEEEERGGDSSSCSSDVMTKKKKKKKKTGSKRNGNGNQRSKKSKNAKGKTKKDKAESHSDRWWNNYYSGNPDGCVSHVQEAKATTGNTAHRLQKVLNGDIAKSDNYSARYLDDGADAQGVTVSGTKKQLEALGLDTGSPKTEKNSRFGFMKQDLVRKKRAGEKHRPIFNIYKDGDDIPAGCLPSNPIPYGPLPASRKNEVFTYNFYCPGFDATYDCLHLASFITTTTEDSGSISDGSLSIST